MNLFSQAQFNRFVDWIGTIQQIPAPTFHEGQRAAYMQSEFARLGMLEVVQDDSGNVLARWPGGNAKPLVISAHLDTVHSDTTPLPLERTDVRLIGPGVADNSTGLAALLGLADKFAAEDIHYPGDIWLAANVCEEGLGNLAGMQALVNRFQGEVQAYLILEGLGLGQVCHRGLGVMRYRVTAETAGGHSWVDYGTPSAIHELVKVMADLTEWTPSHKPRSSLNIGIIQGGISVNTIAPQAHFDLDLRAEDQNALLRLNDRVRRAVQAQEKPGVHFTLESIGNRPAGEIPAGHPLVRLATDILQLLDIPVTLEIGSTDANFPLSCGYPAICIGLTRGGFPHTARETIEIEPLKLGLEQLRSFVTRTWQPVG